MPPKRLSPPPAEDPPASSSSESVETDESDEDSSEEEVLPAQTLKPKQDKNPSSSADESGSDSDSDSDAPPPPKLKISKPAVVDSPSKKEKPTPASKPAVNELAAVTPKKLSVKRPFDSSKDGEASKRAKEKHAEADPVTPEKKAKPNDVEEDPGESEKKPLFQRLWSEEDEIVILKGLIDFSSEKGVDPSTDTEGFYNFIKKSLVSGGNRNQLVDKLRRLKKKYKNHASKVKDGKDKTFSNPHEQFSYDLSKKIWGGDNSVNEGSVDQSKSNGKAKMVMRTESVLLHEGVGFGGLDENVVRRGLGLIDSAKRTELEDKCKNLLIAETELFLRRSELNCELSMLVLDAYKKL